MAGSITRTALNGTKSVLRFIEGSWGKDVGTAYRNAHLKEGKNILTFEWGKAYNDHFIKEGAEKAAKAAASANAKGFWAGVKKLFGKVPGLSFVGRNFMPILMFGPMVVDAFKELFNGGGIGGALKELTKGAIGWTGWGVGTMIAAACGATGVVIPFIVGMAVSSIAGWVATKALGPSTAEKQEVLLAKQEQQKQQEQQWVSNTKLAVNDINREVADMQKLFDKRNNPFINGQYSYCSNPMNRSFVA